MVHIKLSKVHSDWKMISDTFFEKDPLFLQFQGLCLLKSEDKFHLWSKSDDELIKKYSQTIGEKEWSEISKAIFFETGGRFISPKSCFGRWQNHLSSSISKKEWTEEEDAKLMKLVAEIGRKWAEISRLLKNGKNDHMVKNRYISLNRKNASKIQRSDCS